MMISQIDTQIKQLLTVDQVMYYKAIPSKITDDDNCYYYLARK
jgi:hypothetical protein